MNHEKLSYAQLEEKVACLEHKLEEYRILFETIPQPVCLTELETGGILFANEKFCQTSQYGKEEIPGKTLVDLGFLTNESREEVAEELRASGEVKDREVICTLRDGSRLEALQYSRTVGFNGKNHVLTILFNVTGGKKRTAECGQVKKREAVRALVGGAAHDFNNILSVIVGNTELVMGKICRNDPVYVKLERVLDASFRARDVVSRLFSFSRVSAEEKAFKKSSSDEPSLTPSKEKKNILFVDDEELIVEITRQLLESLGHKVESTSGSSDALDMFRSKPDFFDIVITDMTMPKMNGDQLAKNILSIRPDTPIIMCTGCDEMINEEKAREIGIRALMMKPLKREDLNNKILEILSQPDRFVPVCTPRPQSSP